MLGDLGVWLYLPHWWCNFEKMVLLDNIWVLNFLSCVKDVGQEGHTLHCEGWRKTSSAGPQFPPRNRSSCFFIASYTRLSVPQTSRDSPVSTSYLAIKGIADTCCCTGSGEFNSSLHALPTEPALTFDFKITSDSQELTEILLCGYNWTIWEYRLLTCRVVTLKEKRAVILESKSLGWHGLCCSCSFSQWCALSLELDATSIRLCRCKVPNQLAFTWGHSRKVSPCQTSPLNMDLVCRQISLGLRRRGP